MNRKIEPLHIFMVLLAIVVAFSLSLIPDTTLARRGGDDNRVRHYGIIESKPAQGFHGEWVIGGRTFNTSPRTEFDQGEGTLAIGNCAKVDIRNGLVHEIDSEPLRDCQ